MEIRTFRDPHIGTNGRDGLACLASAEHGRLNTCCLTANLFVAQHVVNVLDLLDGVIDGQAFVEVMIAHLVRLGGRVMHAVARVPCTLGEPRLRRRLLLLCRLALGDLDDAVVRGMNRLALWPCRTGLIELQCLLDERQHLARVERLAAARREQTRKWVRGRLERARLVKRRGSHRGCASREPGGGK